MKKIIVGVEEARMVKLDRWKLLVEKNEDAMRMSVDEEVCRLRFVNIKYRSHRLRMRLKVQPGLLLDIFSDFMEDFDSFCIIL